MVFGLLASVANDLMFLSVHVRLLIYLLRCTYLLLTCVLYIFTVSKLQFRHREARLRTHGFWLSFMVFGRFASVANDLMFLFVQVRLLIYLLRSNYLSWPVILCILCIFERFRSCSFGTVRHGCDRAVLGSALDGARPFRIRCQRPHVFVCTRSVAHIPTTVQLPVLTCVLCIYLS